MCNLFYLASYVQEIYAMDGIQGLCIISNGVVPLSCITMVH